MDEDAEIQAMVRLKEVLSNLDQATAVRVLQWAAARYHVSTPVQGGGTPRGGASKDEANSDELDFEDVASLFDAANPSTEAEKVLVVAYWLQVLQGHADIDSQSINTELKHMGHGVGNITRALSNLIERKPRLIIQVRKSGTSQQARKKFKVTTEGIRKVRAMLAGTPISDE